MSGYGAPIPPYEPPDGADTRGSNTGQPQPLPASNDDLRALLEEQRAEIGKAALPFPLDPRHRVHRGPEQLQRLERQEQRSRREHVVATAAVAGVGESLTDEVRQLQQQVSDLSERLPSANRTG